MVKTILAIAVTYLLLGLVMTWFLKQTPYGDNPLWMLILLWPLFLIG